MEGPAPFGQHVVLYTQQGKGDGPMARVVSIRWGRCCAMSMVTVGRRERAFGAWLQGIAGTTTVRAVHGMSLLMRGRRLQARASQPQESACICGPDGWLRQATRQAGGLPGKISALALQRLLHSGSPPL